MSNQTREYGDLVVTLTSAYDPIWDDGGSGANRDGQFWHPKSQGDLRPLGSAGIGNYSQLNGQRATLLVGANPNKPPVGGKPAVANPTGYTQVWNDRGSGARKDGSFWRPTAPPGYVSLGDVAQIGYDAPDVNKIWCLRSDLVADGTYGPDEIWDDRGSGAKGDVSIWAVVPNSLGIGGSEKLPTLAGTFRSNGGYSQPDTGVALVPVLLIPKDFTRFEAPVPTITADSLPSAGDTFAETKQCQVTMPFTAFFEPTDRRSLDNIRDPFCTVDRSISWSVIGVYVNNSGGTITRSTTVKTGVTHEESTEMTHSAGVEISAKQGIGLASYSVSLNYQFTYSSSSSFSEYEEREITEGFTVPPYHATVAFGKHILMKSTRADGSTITAQIDFNANDDLRLSGVPLKESRKLETHNSTYN